MAEAVAAGIGFDVVAAKGEQRPYHMPLNRQDAMETREPRATQKVDEKGFGGIVTMVCGEHCGVAMFTAERVEPVVAKLPGSLLDALPVAAGMG